MRNTLAVARRELTGYFATPVAYVFIVIFLVLSGTLTFTLGGFFDRGVADLSPFFQFVPWLFLFLVPALTMRLWAEERRLGTIELLLTLPIAQWQAVLGKFLAAWVFCAIALALTFPLVVTVNILGSPDNGVIATGYLGCLLVAGAYLAVGAAVSALTKCRTGSEDDGIPITPPVGRARASPSTHTSDRSPDGSTRESASPSSVKKSTASWRRAKKASAPMSVGPPSKATVWSLPPIRSVAS